MAEQARVTSLEALETFRANLIVFIATAHRCVDEVGDEVRHTRQWLQHDQRMHWEGETRRWRRQLDAAQQELYSARLSALRERTTMQENAVRKAKAALEHAEEKLRRVKHWNRNYDHAAEPMMKGMQSLRDFLDHDLPKGLAFLLQAQRTLEAYAESRPAPAPAPTPAPEDSSAP